MAYKIGGWIDGSIRQAVPEEPTARPPTLTLYVAHERWIRNCMV